MYSTCVGGQHVIQKIKFATVQYTFGTSSQFPLVHFLASIYLTGLETIISTFACMFSLLHPVDHRIP